MPNTTASTPRPAALRKIDPRFSWSLTPSSTATVRAPSSTCATVSSGGPRRRRQHAAVEMEADHLGHHVGVDPVVRRVDAGQVVGELGQPPVGAQQRPGAEPGGQHALHHQHALGDHQALAAGQVGPAVHAVEIAEVVEPRVSRVGDVDYVGSSRAFVDDARHQIGGDQERLALVGLEPVEALLEPLLAGAALGLDQVGARRATPRPAPDGRRPDARCARRSPARPARRSPASSTAAGRVRAWLTRRASSGPPWQASTAPTAATAKQGNPDAGTAIGEPDGSLPATDHSPAGRRGLSQSKEYLAASRESRGNVHSSL